MTAALRLGWRLGLHGPGALRLRSSLVAVATCLGTVLMLGVLAIARAEQGAHTSLYANSAESRRLLYAVVLIVSLPMLALVATAGRLSAELRQRRLANLRLLGLTPLQTRAVAAAEAAVGALAGVAVGAVLFQPVRLLLVVVGPAGRGWELDTLTPGGLAYVLACAGVLLTVVAVAVLPQHIGLVDGLAHVRRASSRRPSWLRLLPLAAGTVICLQQIWRQGQRTADVVWVLFVGVPLLGIGLVLVVPVLVRLLADLLLRTSAGPVVTMAARRMQAQPAAVTRVVGALLIGLFVVTGARGVVAAFEFNARDAARQLTDHQRVGINGLTLAEVDSAIARLRTVEGVQHVYAFPMLATEPGCERSTFCANAIVASCRQLSELVPDVAGCVDDAPMWVGGHVPAPATLSWVPASDTGILPEVVAQTAAPRTVLGQRMADALAPSGPSVVVPPSLVDLTALPPTTSAAVLVVGEPGRSLGDRVSGIGDSSITAADFGAYDFAVGLRSLVWAVAAVLLSVGLLAFAIASIDRAVARRREVVSLQLLGTPARLLRRAQWLEAALPIGLGVVLAVGAGALASAAYLDYASAASPLVWADTASLAAIALIGAVGVAALTVVAASPGIRPDLIRRE